MARYDTVIDSEDPLQKKDNLKERPKTVYEQNLGGGGKPG